MRHAVILLITSGQKGIIYPDLDEVAENVRSVKGERKELSHEERERNG